SLSSTATYDSGTNKLTFSYTISLANSGSSSQNVDLVTDTPDASLTFVAGSAQFNSATISDPSTSTLNSSDVIFSGPFTVPANTTRTLTYRMIQRNGCTSGSFSYTNSATATLGQLIIGSGASTYSLVVGSGTCANTTTTVTVTNTSLAPTAITNAASGITSTAATFNASVDPNAQSGWTVSFEWGTTSSLTSTAITLADLTTASSTAYSVSSSRTGLSTGTTYYYRIKLSKTGSTTVYGEIVSFTTLEPVADPTASTTNITNVSVSGSNVSVTFNGSIDPNQVTNGVKVRFEYAKRNSSSTTCTDNIGTTNYAPSSSTFVQIEDTTNTTDLILFGAFPTSVEYLNSSSSNVVVLNTGASGFNTTYFCFRIVGLYNASTANWATSVYGDWVAFTASNKTAQTITYTQPANMIVGGTSTSATATATSSLAVTYSSADTSICTVNSSTGEITAVSEGICTLTASQSGNDSFYEATPVSVSFTITAVAPTATTVAASSISTTTTTINGTINGGGASTTTTFCYGTASNLTGCSTVTATQSPVTGATNTSVSYNLTGLSSGTTYYFRVSGTNSIGSSTGSILNFTTKVTVTYDANSATSGSVPVDASSPYDVNSSVTVKANTGSLARSGYTFSGWNTNAAATGTSYTSSGSDTFTLSTASVVLYAKWTALTYSITYDANGGTGTTASQSGSGASSVTLNANGFSNGANNFVGWSTTSGAGNSKTYDAGQVLSITTDLSLTLYAVWSASPTYTATLVSATGGTATQSATTLISGSTLEIVATASSGYTFSSWSCTMNSVTTTYNTSTVSFTVTANVTCTPTFTINSYNFGYDANGGTGSAPANTVSKNYNSSVTVASNTYTRSNYRFSNWHTTSAGTGGTSYSATDTFNMPASNVTLYAQWTQVWTVTVGTLTNGTGSSISIATSPSAAGET
ncbi:MAG: beta strand repeat-containing protein, partial [Actinomycetes bacterium]